MAEERGRDPVVPGAPGGAEGEGDREEPGLEARLGRLEAIVRALETEDVELERALALFEEGVRHVRHAERILAEAELRVEELIGGEGASSSRPFAPEEAAASEGDGER